MEACGLPALKRPWKCLMWLQGFYEQSLAEERRISVTGLKHEYATHSIHCYVCDWPTLTAGSLPARNACAPTIFQIVVISL